MQHLLTMGHPGTAPANILRLCLSVVHLAGGAEQELTVACTPSHLPCPSIYQPTHVAACHVSCPERIGQASSTSRLGADDRLMPADAAAVSLNGSRKELRARDPPPPRTLVLLTCELGTNRSLVPYFLRRLSTRRPRPWPIEAEKSQ